MITAEMVKELRQTTGVGMMDCKKALVETKGNISEAVDYLREKRVSSGCKKQDVLLQKALLKLTYMQVVVLVLWLNLTVKRILLPKQIILKV